MEEVRMRQEKTRLGTLSEPLPLEDMVLKTAVQYFGDELLPYLGIREKVHAVTPTEQIHLEARRLTEDYNFAKQDGSWIHLEFESDSVRKDDLRRFREYEALISYTYRVEVTTYVVCSSRTKTVLSSLTQGINTYHVIPIRLKDWNADQLFSELFKKKEDGELLEKQDLAPALLAPLMSGDMPQKERIVCMSRLLKAADTLNKDEILKMQAVLYALANKFLDDEELEQVKEVLSMTRLGEMLVNDGIEKGMEKGIQAMITAFQELGISYEESVRKIKEKFALDPETARGYMEKYWR